MLDFLWFTLLLNPVLSEDIATNTTTVSSTTITVSYTTTLQSIASLSLPSETSYLSTTSMSAIVSTGDWPTTTTDYIPTTTTDYIPTTTTDDIPTTTTDDNPTTTELDIEPTGTDTDIIDDTVTEDDLQPTSYVVPKHKQCTIPEIESFYPERSVIYFSPTYQDDIPISCGLQLCLRYSPNMVHKSDAFTPDGGDIDPETQPPENIGTSENTNIHNNGHVNDGDQIPGGGDDSPDGNPDGDVLPDDSGDLSPNDGKEEGADGSIAIDVVLIGECINNCTENQLIPNQKDFELLQKVLGLNSDKEAMSFYLTRSKCDGTSMKGIMEQRQIFFNANATINRVGVTPWNPTVNPNPSPDNSRAVDSRSPSNAVVSNISGNTDSSTQSITKVRYKSETRNRRYFEYRCTESSRTCK
ncbi:hypothetical protein BC833DRAFT_19542 [Globomyces pollinis-pini]|nr:hypothetical protein BC833DRAFT_19542 [Globomyces pollinis-pini]